MIKHAVVLILRFGDICIHEIGVIRLFLLNFCKISKGAESYTGFKIRVPDKGVLQKVSFMLKWSSNSLKISSPVQRDAVKSEFQDK